MPSVVCICGYVLQPEFFLHTLNFSFWWFFCFNVFLFFFYWTNRFVMSVNYVSMWQSTVGHSVIDSNDPFYVFPCCFFFIFLHFYKECHPNLYVVLSAHCPVYFSRVFWLIGWISPPKYQVPTTVFEHGDGVLVVDCSPFFCQTKATSQTTQFSSHPTTETTPSAFFLFLIERLCASLEEQAHRVWSPAWSVSMETSCVQCCSALRSCHHNCSLSSGWLWWWSPNSSWPLTLPFLIV